MRVDRRFVLASSALFVAVFVAALGSAAASDESTAEPRAIRVALYDDAGAGKSVEDAARALAGREDVAVERVTAAEIRGGTLDRFDVLIQPGGSGGGQGRALGEEGRDRVRAFVREGGGYVGVCAGAYLASARYEWSLGLIDATVVDTEHWARGAGKVDLAVSGRGHEVLGLGGETVPFHYENGPLLAPAGDPELPDYEPLATFAGEVAENGAPRGVMPGKTAIAAGRYGEGRVLCFSPHPEKSEATPEALARGVRWAAGPQQGTRGP